MTSAGRSFKVPFGRDPLGQIVALDHALPRVVYACPACATPLLLKAGEIRRRHFAHRAEANCSVESALHEATKWLIANAVSAWRAGTGRRPIVRRRCPRCQNDVDSELAERVTQARVECRLPSGRILDIGLLDAAGSVVLGVEVLVTHAVDEAKEAHLGELPWLEILADARDDPTIWRPHRLGGRFSPVRCQECEQRPQRRRTATAALAAKYGLAEPPRGYFAVETSCWRCHKPMPVFFWPGIGFGHPAPSPQPRTVKMRFSKTVSRRYLSNGCVHCDALCGDFYLEKILIDAVGDAPDAPTLHEIFFAPSTPSELEASARAAVDFLFGRVYGDR